MPQEFALSSLLLYALGFLSLQMLSVQPDDAIREAREDARHVLLDVRSEAEWQINGVKGSLNIPHTRVKAEAKKLPTDKGTPIIAYCSSGTRVKIALLSLNELGYFNVVNAVTLERFKSLLGTDGSPVGKRNDVCVPSDSFLDFL